MIDTIPVPSRPAITPNFKDLGKYKTDKNTIDIDKKFNVKYNEVKLIFKDITPFYYPCYSVLDSHDIIKQKVLNYYKEKKEDIKRPIQTTFYESTSKEFLGDSHHSKYFDKKMLDTDLYLDYVQRQKELRRVRNLQYIKNDIANKRKLPSLEEVLSSLKKLEEDNIKFNVSSNDLEDIQKNKTDIREAIQNSLILKNKEDNKQNKFILGIDKQLLSLTKKIEKFYKSKNFDSLEDKYKAKLWQVFVKGCIKTLNNINKNKLKNELMKDSKPYIEFTNDSEKYQLSFKKVGFEKIETVL